MGGFFDGGLSGIGSAVGSIAGGVLGLIGSGNSAANAAAINRQNYEAQKEFAQNGIRWKVADAKAAGLHPLAALGAQTSSYSPSAVLGDSPDYSFLRDAGQGIGRAIDAKMTQKERAAQQERDQMLFNLQLKNAYLEGEERKARIRGLDADTTLSLARASQSAVRSQQQVPAMPVYGSDGRIMPGQGDSTGGLFKVTPPELMASHPQTPFAEAGTHPEVRYFRTADGGYSISRSDAYADSSDDDFFAMRSWDLRNRLPASIWDSASSAPPRSYLPDSGRGDWDWTFNPFMQAYYPYRKGDWKSRIKGRFYGR